MSEEVSFLLNGQPVRISGQPSTRTLLDWLREDRGLTGTKEGCNEGDCGACTIILTDDRGSRAVNGCILFLPQLNGKAVRTVEGISGPGGEMHPVQAAMVEHHGSQCGFCTPGIVAALAAAHSNGETAFDDVLAGNLCRCTGYAPIIRAAEAAAADPVPAWMQTDREAVAALGASPLPFAPTSADDLAIWYAETPDATLSPGPQMSGSGSPRRCATLRPWPFWADART